MQGIKYYLWRISPLLLAGTDSQEVEYKSTVLYVVMVSFFGKYHIFCRIPQQPCQLLVNRQIGEHGTISTLYPDVHHEDLIEGCSVMIWVSQVGVLYPQNCILEGHQLWRVCS